MNKHASFNKIGSLAGNPAGIVAISGISGVEIAPVIGAGIDKGIKQGLVIVPEKKPMKDMSAAIAYFTELPVSIWPDKDEFIFFDTKDSADSETKMKIIKSLVKGEDLIVLATGASLMTSLPSMKDIEENKIHMRLGEEHDLKLIIKKLISSGYERSDVCEASGQFCLRGGILDVYPVGEDFPVRMEFFDTEIDSIRKYDMETQRSVTVIEEVEIYPRLIYDTYKSEFEDRGNIGCMNGKALLFDYFKEEAIFYFDDPDRVFKNCINTEEERNAQIKEWGTEGISANRNFEHLASYKDFLKIKEHKKIWLFEPFPKAIKQFDRQDALFQIRAKTIWDYANNTELLIQDIKDFLKNEYEINFVCNDKSGLESVKKFLIQNDVFYGVSISLGTIPIGLEYPDEKIVYMTDETIFGYRRKKKIKKKRSKKDIKNFADIQKGDYVVHDVHGIGKFVGIETITVLGAVRDYLKVQYAGEDSLYIPVDQMHLIQKYIGGGGKTPRISKLSGAEWKKTREKAKLAVMDMASEILELNAERMAGEGHGFSKDTLWQQEFEDMFPYQETEDQLRAIDEIKKDMEESVPMDRLLCGDVGYGKTEVAARAIFKCLADGMQAAILVPTTLLASQHYYTMKDRFEHFPFKVEMLSRFRTQEQQKEILKGVGNGSIDMVIGTHRLLSEDVKFKDLGFLVIDEEQRFGVKHKEKIKMLKKHIDVLTLSATPIPRTLNMSLIGIKSMSIIAEPPEDRYPVETYVMEMQPHIIKAAIEKEIDRGGQVFIVYNRVKGIYKLAKEIADMLPTASVAVGHGRMNEKELEDIMLSFVNGENDVLVSTTIIETGIDISNANTMIIMDADRFGLSQLYQLRGRVGRSTRKAYTYLLYTPEKVLTEQAVKRLKAIRDFTEFGAGFRVAMRDLEIRGAGNMLGTKQSGHMMDVGYEMYCRLLSEAVSELKGEAEKKLVNETSIEFSVSAYIPERYIGDEYTRLDIYKRIADIESADDMKDVTDELTDRFGHMPEEVMNLIKVAFIKSKASKSGITTIKFNGNKKGDKITFEFLEGEAVDREAISKIMEKYKMRATVYGSVKPVIKINKLKEDMLDELMDFLGLFS